MTLVGLLQELLHSNDSAQAALERICTRQQEYSQQQQMLQTLIASDPRQIAFEMESDDTAASLLNGLQNSTNDSGRQYSSAVNNSKHHLASALRRKIRGIRAKTPPSHTGYSPLDSNVTRQSSKGSSRQIFKGLRKHFCCST